MSYKKNSPRALALKILCRVLKNDNGTGAESGSGYSNILINSAISSSGIGGADRGLLTRLVNGVIERKLTLDYIIGTLSSRPVAKLDPDVLNLLRMGIYQLRFMERIPPHAAINETVDLAKPSGRGFVNAILRSCQRRGDIPLPEISKKNSAEYCFSVRYSVSEGLCRELIRIYGKKTAESILSASFDGSSTPMTLRVNTLRTDRKTLGELLAGEGFVCRDTRFSPWGINILSGGGIPSAVSDGLAFVQDEASQLCALALEPYPGCSLLDACACPGSKSFSSALLMENRGSVTSCDLHESKLPLISDEAKKLGITVIKPVCRDSSAPFDDGRKFDRVICDVPCSGFGVMAKKPEIRYRSPDDTRDLPDLQYRILCASSDSLAPGGILVYSTCTILPAENEENARRFLSEHPDFAPVPFEFISGSNAGNISAPEGMLTLLPGQYGTDGFFIAKFTRKKG